MSTLEEIKDKFKEIGVMLIDFCDEKLNEDYEDLCLLLLEKLCYKRPPPILSGKASTWAAGIAYAIGSNNFIFDKTQKLHLTAKELASYFGVSPGTASSKAAELKKMFKIDYFNSEWILPELKENNPMIWAIKVNGLIVDARDMPLEIQQQAFEMGIIPYVPGEEK